MRRTTTIAISAILIPSVCFAWGRDGHRITGFIAAKYLTPQAAAAVKDLLGNESLADASTWPDEIRRERKHTAPWHYANPAPGSDGFNLERDCPEEGCVVGAIIKFAHVLRDKKASRQERIEALKFLVHFVGDVHQPLHLGRARDRGGNDIKVTFFEDNTNLHSVWDSGLIRRAKGKRTWQKYATDLRSRIAGKYPAAWARLDPSEWATESYKLAVSHAYVIPKDGQLGQAYFYQCGSVVEDRLTAAGVRLAALLNVIFDETEEMPF
jgi:hypothetical protein